MCKKNSLFYRSVLSMLLLAATCCPSLWAQNVRIGTVDQGTAYSIPAGVTHQTMTFTESGATATASSESTWNGRIVLDADGTLNVSTTSDTGLTVGGGISGAAALLKSGNGTLLLNSASTQTGETVINAGTIRAGKNKVLSAKSAFFLNSGTLDLNGTEQEIASLSGGGTLKFGSAGTGSLTVGGNDSDRTFSGTVSDQGRLTKTGTGTLFLTGSASSVVALDVESGILAVNGDFSANGASATVRETGTLGGIGTLYDLTVETGGTLAPGNRTGAEVLATDTLTVKHDLTLASESTLSIRVDDVGNTDKVMVSGTFTNTDGEANLEIDALAGSYADSEVAYGNFLVDGAGIGIANFEVDRISLRQKFLQLNNVSADDNSFQLARIRNFFASRAQTHNQRQLASVLDRTGASPLWNAMTNLSNATDQDEINDASIEMAGSIKANSLLLGQWRTSRHGLNHLDLSSCGTNVDATFWLEFTHQSIDVDANCNSRDYGISRTGILLGSEERCDNFVFGMLGGYSLPYLYSHGDKYKTGDLQFGFYSGTKVADRVETKLYIGFGSQSYDSKRFIRNSLLLEDGSANRIDGDFSGNSMSMALEFAVPFEFGTIGLRPLVGVDSDLSWQYGYAETGDTGLELAFGRSFYDRTYLRTGLTAQWGSGRRCSPFSLVGRFYYGYQVSGTPFPTTSCNFVADPSVSMLTYGAKLGKEYANLGIGFRWCIDACRGFYGDYDYSKLNYATGHSGSIGFMQKW